MAAGLLMGAGEEAGNRGASEWREGGREGACGSASSGNKVNKAREQTFEHLL